MPVTASTLIGLSIQRDRAAPYAIEEETVMTRATEKAPAGEATSDPALAHASPSVMGFGRFSAMNTEVRLLTLAFDSRRLMEEAQDVFHDIEQRFSRFLPDSELSLLNNRRADHVRASSEMTTILKLCVRMNRATGGLFDPAILPSLEHAGYDRSFELVPSEQSSASSAAPEPLSIAAITLDESRSVVRMPGGMRLDLGGIGKGYAVDRAAEAMAPLRDYLIDAGGDIFASGSGPSSSGWLVAVGHPVSPDIELLHVVLRDEAIATSSIARRRWRRGKAEQHHIIDPRRGVPAQTDCLSVSVIAPTAVEADVYGKCALILGYAGGRLLLESRNLPGLFLLADGKIETTGTWEGR
jgi:thiamine biosynthesis lipoprotein